MSDFNKALRKQIQKVPKILLRRSIEKKLKEQGLHQEDLPDALIDHMLSMSTEAFHWDDGDEGPAKEIAIEFTDQDVEGIEKEFKAFLAEGLHSVITETVNGAAEDIVKSIEGRWPELRIYHRNEVGYFRDRLDLRWAPGLDPLRMMLISSREIGQIFAEKLARSKAKNNIVKRTAIVLLHMRACQTTMEILTLLENGLPDGAYARWRTLYEISVVGFFIDRHGDEAAERYLAHDIVSMRDAAVNEYRHAGISYEAEKLTGGLKKMEEEYQATLVRFDKPFAGPYGWAAHSLKKKDPRLKDLEEAIDWNALPPEYKWSSLKIHAGVAGTVRSLGSIDGSRTVHAGATNAGLERPAINTAFSLLHVTSLIFGRLADLETQTQMRSLVILRDRVVKECLKTAKRPLKENADLHAGFSR